MLSIDPIPGYVRFTFEQGITYADIITLNFTLTVDPDDERVIGSDEETSTIVISPSCQLVDIDPAITYDNDIRACGDMVHVPIKVDSSGKILCAKKICVSNQEGTYV